MIKIFFTLWIVLSLFLVEKTNCQIKKTTIFYKFYFKDVNNEESILKSIQEIKKIKEVKNVKYLYKKDIKTLMIEIETEQKIRQSESDEEFKLTDLKKIFINNGLIYYDLKINEIKK